MSTAPRKTGNEVNPGFPVGQGYSLLETMTVIVVILTLASLATPAFRTLIVRGREAVLREDLFTLRAQIDHFIHDYGRGPASLEELVEKEYMGSIPTDPFTGSNQTWQLDMQDASDAADALTPQPGIIDIHSGCPNASLDGTVYSRW